MLKKGFSLVELLIVLAVMAALISVVTPVAMNAIRKSKAAKLAQSFKTLVTNMQNKVMLESENLKELNMPFVFPYITDVDTLWKYNIRCIDDLNGTIIGAVSYNGNDVDFDSVQSILPGAKYANANIIRIGAVDDFFYIDNGTGYGGNMIYAVNLERPIAFTDTIYYEFAISY